MEAIKYRYSGGHKTVLDIGDNDTLVHVAIGIAIEKYKTSFRNICKEYYKEGNKNFLKKAMLDDTKKAIRDLRDIREALDQPKETVDQIGARTMVSQLF